MAEAGYRSPLARELKRRSKKEQHSTPGSCPGPRCCCQQGDAYLPTEFSRSRSTMQSKWAPHGGARWLGGRPVGLVLWGWGSSPHFTPRTQCSLGVLARLRSCHRARKAQGFTGD